MAITTALVLSVFMALCAMFQAGFNPTSFNTIQTYVEEFANKTSQKIQQIKRENITHDELKAVLEQNVANLNGWFQLLAMFGALVPLLMEVAPRFKKMLGTKASFGIPITLTCLGSVTTGTCVYFSSYKLLFYGSLLKGVASCLLYTSPSPRDS